MVSPRPTVFVVANILKKSCCSKTLFLSRSVKFPSLSKTLCITNITSGLPASYSSKTKATGFCIDHGSIPSLNSVTCFPSFKMIASFPIKSILLIWLSKFTLIHGQFNLAATCSMCVDFPVPWYPCIKTLLLNEKPAIIARVVSLSNL